MQPVTKDVEPAVFDVLREYAGKKTVTEDSLLAADLHIDGSDSVEVLDKLEELFRVDLRPLIERGPLERNTVFHRMFGVPPRKSGVDVSVRELIDFILAGIR